jgi:hypothetical protein
MNTRSTPRIFARVASMSFAFFFTFAMLAGVDGLATQDVNPHSLLAAAAASQPAHG